MADENINIEITDNEPIEINIDDSQPIEINFSDGLPPTALRDLTDVESYSVSDANKILKVNSDGTSTTWEIDQSGTDEKVKYDASDPTAGYIADKFIAGDGISLSEGEGENENKLIITNISEGNTDHSALDNLSYELSGHTGFQPSGSYLTSETDPVFISSQAYNIDADDITNLGNLSGTNTGDETESTILTKLGITSISGENTGDQTSSDFNLADLSDVDKTSIGIGKILKIGLDGVTHEYVDDESGTDEKVKYDASDPTAGYIADKIIAGTGISVAEGTGADENKLIITNDAPAPEETDPVFSSWLSTTPPLYPGGWYDTDQYSVNISGFSNDVGFLDYYGTISYAENAYYASYASYADYVNFEYDPTFSYAPYDGNTYGWNNGAWTIVAGDTTFTQWREGTAFSTSGGLTGPCEFNNDSTTYARYWNLNNSSIAEWSDGTNTFTIAGTNGLSYISGTNDILSTLDGTYVQHIDAGTSETILYENTKDSTDTVIPFGTFGRNSTGTPANGIGGSIDLKLMNADSTKLITGQIENKLTSVTSSAEVSEVNTKVLVAGTLTEKFKVTSNGIETDGDIKASGTGANGIILYDTTLAGYYRVTLNNGVLTITAV